jgi:hypothetical protein
MTISSAYELLYQEYTRSASSCPPLHLDKCATFALRMTCHAVLVEAPISESPSVQLQCFPSFSMRRNRPKDCPGALPLTGILRSDMFPNVPGLSEASQTLGLLVFCLIQRHGRTVRMMLGKLAWLFSFSSHDILGRPGCPRQVAFLPLFPGLFQQLIITRLFPLGRSSSKHEDQPVSPFSSRKNTQ